MEEKVELRHKDAERMVAEVCPDEWGPQESVNKIIAYYTFLEDLHIKYDLDEDEHYTFDMARGIIYTGIE